MSLVTRTFRLLPVVCLFIFLVAVPSNPVSAEQVRLSTTGGIGNDDHWTDYPETAFNSVRNEFLVVWTASDDGDGQAPSERELFARRISAESGLPLSPQFRLTFFGDVGDETDRPDQAALAYNPDLDEYLLVFAGFWDGEKEIYGLILNGSGGPISSPFRISDMGPNLDPGFLADTPDVVYNSNHMEYLVVWFGDDDTGGHVDGEFEIYAQRVSVDGMELGDNDVRISEAGSAGEQDFDAKNPSIAFDPVRDRYLLAWIADDDLGTQVDNEFEVFIQLLHGQFITPLLGMEQRISAVDGLGTTSVQTAEPAVAFHPGVDEYLVAWNTFDSGGAFGRRLMAQRIDALTGAEIGDDDQILMPEASVHYRPALSYSPATGEYLIATAVGDDDPPAGIGGEIFRLRLSAEAQVLGEPSRQSYMGIGPGTFDAESPALAVHGGTGASLAVWTGDHDGNGMVDNEYEIFSQFTGTQIFSDDFESGNLLAWSLVVD